MRWERTGCCRDCMRNRVCVCSVFTSDKCRTFLCRNFGAAESICHRSTSIYAAKMGGRVCWRWLWVGYMHYYITKQPRLNSCAIKNISKYIFYRITLSVLSVYAVVCCAVVCTGACALLPWLQLEPLNVSRSTQVSGYGYPSATRRKQYMKTKKITESSEMTRKDDYASLFMPPKAYENREHIHSTGGFTPLWILNKFHEYTLYSQEHIMCCIGCVNQNGVKKKWWPFKGHNNMCAKSECGRYSV